LDWTKLIEDISKSPLTVKESEVLDSISEYYYRRNGELTIKEKNWLLRMGTRKNCIKWKIGG